MIPLIVESVFSAVTGSIITVIPMMRRYNRNYVKLKVEAYESQSVSFKDG